MLKKTLAITVLAASVLASAACCGTGTGCGGSCGTTCSGCKGMNSCKGQDGGNNSCSSKS